MYWFENIKIPEEISEGMNELTEKIVKQYDGKTMYFMEILHTLMIQMQVNGSPLMYSISATQYDNVAHGWYVARNFRAYKQIFVVSRTLMQSLKQTQGLEKIPGEVFNNLPYPSFYIDLEQHSLDVLGVFVCREKYAAEGTYIQGGAYVMMDNVQILIKLRSGDIPSLSISMGETIDEAIQRLWSVETMGDEAVSKLKSLFIDVMQIVMYLCTAKPDIVQRKVHNTTKKVGGGKKRPPKSPTVNEVGYVIGATFGKPKIEYINHADGTGGGKGTSKAPHFRRAHWMVVHTGKGRTQTELRWVAMTYVNGNGVGEEPTKATLHNTIHGGK